MTWSIVGALLRLKSPEVAGGLTVMAAGVRFVSVKRVVALVLWIGTGPKSSETGVRRRPVCGRTSAVRARM